MVGVHFVPYYPTRIATCLANLLGIESGLSI